MSAEFQGVWDLLDSVPLLAGKLKDTSVQDDGKAVRGNYVVLFGAGPESLDDGRYGSIPRGDSDALFEFPGRAVGTDPEAVRLIVGAVQGTVGRKPTVVGRRADPVTVVFEQVKVDTSVSPPLYFSDFWVRFGSRRA